MFENLRRAFKEAFDNFTEELNRDQVPETVDRLLRGMYQEVTDAQTYVHGLEEQIARTEKAVAKEAAEIATCHRREEMATKIGDEETARIAREYGAKHERTQDVLEQKAKALREELKVRRAEVTEMLAKVKEAKEQRDALTAQAGRTDAHQTIGQADDLFAELDRMAEKISGEQSQADAAEELWYEIDSGLGPEPEAEPETTVDERLAELKRRMGRE